MEWAAGPEEAVARAGAGAPLVVHVVPAAGGNGAAATVLGEAPGLRGCVGLRVERGSLEAQQLGSFVPLRGDGERVLMIGAAGRVLAECGPERLETPESLLADLERGLAAQTAAQKQEALAAALRVIAAQAPKDAAAPDEAALEREEEAGGRADEGAAASEHGAGDERGEEPGDASGVGTPPPGEMELGGEPPACEPRPGMAEGGVPASLSPDATTGSDDKRMEPLEPLEPLGEDREETNAEPMQATAPRTSLIQIKLTSGEPLVGEFDADCQLADVYDYIDIHRTDGYTPYKLVVPFPRRTLGEADLVLSLRDLDLHPRAALMLVATGPPSGMAAAGDTAPALATGGLLSYLSSTAAKVLKPLEGLLTTSTSEERPEEESVPRRAAAKRRFGGNVHSLHEERQESGTAEPSKGGPNEYWNGNSTQFAGDDKKDD